ncbi:glycosyltransferase family 2 protein [Rhizorhabdus argentea]|uniref:glycosyltransferase family 2 protein n=1 Tax=Rhizorhabdus argentea TaxID=1387174 RepID=UPI0030EDEBED
MPRIMLIATMRNEGPFLIEWVAYHRLIGFTDILVCTNDCDDGSPDLLDALQEQGLLHHLRCYPAPDEQAQLFAYRTAEAELGGQWADVLMVLDADEFLNIHVGDGGVIDLLGAVPEATSVLINWRIFGSSGHRSWSADPVTRRFLRAAPLSHGVNRSFKTLFTRADAYHCPLLPHGPGHAKADRLGELHAVDGAGTPLPSRFACAEEFLQSDPDAVTWSLAQVNHYNTRSWEDYLAKHHRGGGLGPERWDRDSNWAAFNRNEELDLTIQRHRTALDHSVSEILSIPSVQRRYEDCLIFYGGHIARLAQGVAA